jgi:16S rRNA processing protein RimM
MTDSRPPYLLIGEVLRPHGIRGEVRMRLLTAYPERIATLGTVWLAESLDAPTREAYQVEGMRMNPPYGLLKLKGIDDRTIAERLRGLMVMIDIDHAVPLEEGEFYLYQLIGLEVVQADGEPLGTLTDVLEAAGANDVYIVDSPVYGEVLIPVTPHTIIRTDMDARRLTVQLPEGLLPPPKKPRA